MSLPTSQAKDAAPRSKTSIIHRNPFTAAEGRKVDALLRNKKSIFDIGDKEDFKRFLLCLDSIFGESYKQREDRIILRGKIEYVQQTIDPETGENQVLCTLSDPRALYRRAYSEPIRIRTPYNAGLLIGSYVKIEIPKGRLSAAKGDLFVENEEIEPLSIELNLPQLFLDYEKFSEIFRYDYRFEISNRGQKYRRNMELSNTDLLLINKVAGENFHDEVKGGVNENVIKTRREQDTYTLEILDEYLNKITRNQEGFGIFDKNQISGGSLEDFKTTLNINNRKITTTAYRTYYGCNKGFSLGRISHKEADEFIEELPNSNIDYLNPIEEISTRTMTQIKRMLNHDEPHIYSSRALFLEAKLLPIKSKLSTIMNVKPKVLRIATMLNKFENCINDLGTDEVLPKINLRETEIDRATQFLKNNEEDVIDFITHRS